MPLPASACMEKVGTEKLLFDSAKVMDCKKGPVELVASRTLGELLVRVKLRSVGGAAANEIDRESSCRF